ncbi:MAG: hypothetical protein AAFN74_15150, partial [Myxococcota bacterium]
MRRPQEASLALLAGLAAAGVLGSVSPAHAQQYLVSRTTSISYASLSAAATVLTTDADNDAFTIASPFPIRFFGNVYTSVRAGVNGALLFPDQSQPISSINPTPGSSAPNNFIAPLWDDHRIFDNGALSWEVIGDAPNRRLAIEWRNISGCCTQGSYDATFKVAFNESPAMSIDVEYGAISRATRDFSATLAMEDADGDRVIIFTPTACGAACDTAVVTGISNSRVTIRPGPTPDLTGTVVATPRGARPGTVVTATLALTNLGTNRADAVRSELWLSADADLDAADDFLLWSDEIDLPFGDTPVVVTATMPPVPIGDYFVFLRMDEDNAFAEFDELNNIVRAPQMFATGPELSVESIS